MVGVSVPWPSRVAAAIVSVQPGAPALKAFIRKPRAAQDKEEVLEYVGAPTLGAVLGWLREVDALQDSHEDSAPEAV